VSRYIIAWVHLSKIGRTIIEHIRAVDIVGRGGPTYRDKQGGIETHDVLVPIPQRAMNTATGAPARLMPKTSVK
jgi:hypothetical protein